MMATLVDVRTNKQAIFICDGHEPYSFRTPEGRKLHTRRIVAISSPRFALLNEFAKRCPPERRLYLPLPSLEVLLEMRDRCFSKEKGLSDAEVRDRVKIWGAVPRSVLLQKEGKIEADAFVQKQRIGELLDYAGSGIFDPVSFPGGNVSSRILSPVIDPVTYQSTGICFTSKYLSFAVFEAASSVALQHLQKFVSNILKDPDMLSIHRFYFERWAFKQQ
jgi:hypothetical protein